MENQEPVPPPGWLTTLQVAEALGMTRRQFQEHTRSHPAAKIKLMGRPGNPCYYDPQVIDQVRQDRAEAARSSFVQTAPQPLVDQPKKTNEREAKNETSAEKRVAAAGIAKTRSARRSGGPKPGPLPSEKQDLLHDLLQCAKANTAMLDRIAQNIGRIG